MNAEPFGRDLHRPECVHCTAQGDVFVSDWRGGVTRIRSDGSQQLFKGDRAVKTNGFAILPDRSFLLAHLGDDDGGVFRLASDGALSVFLDDLPPTNFVHAHGDTVYVTVSTRLVPRTLARKPGYADGFIVCVDRRGTRVVAEGLGYTNECKVDPTRKWLYVNETFGKRLSRFALRPDGDLGARETVAEFGAGTFPDGLDYDAEGGVWITSVFSNRLIRIAPGGEQRVLLEDNDSRFVARIEEQFARGELVRDVHPEVPAKLIRNLSSSAFGGEDLRTLYLGCLQDSRIYRMPSPVAGARPPHWDVRFT